MQIVSWELYNVGLYYLILPHSHSQSDAILFWKGPILSATVVVNVPNKDWQ